MKVQYILALRAEGTLDELIETAGARASDEVVELADVITSLRDLAFIGETVAHLRGMEATILPTTDKARALIAKLSGGAA